MIIQFHLIITTGTANEGTSVHDSNLNELIKYALFDLDIIINKYCCLYLQVRYNYVEE